MIKFKKTVTRDGDNIEAVLKESTSFHMSFNKESKKWETDFEYSGNSIFISVMDTDFDGSKSIRKLTDKVTIVDVTLEVEKTQAIKIEAEGGFLYINLISERSNDGGRFCRISVSEWVYSDLIVDE